MATLPNRGVTPAGFEGYDAIVLASDFEVEGVEGDVPPAYDYRRQTWMDSADHVHVDEACHLEPMWCGADLVTCQGVAVTA